MTWKRKVESHVSCQMRFDEHKCKSFYLVLGQCIDASKNKFEAIDECRSKVEETHDVIELLKMIKNAACEFEGKEHLQAQLCHACKTFFKIKQNDNENATAFCHRFAKAAEATENCGDKFGDDDTNPGNDEMHQALDVDEKLKLENIAASMTCMRDKCLVHACVEKMDPEQLHDMKKELENDCAKGKSSCKVTIQDVHAFMSNHKINGSNQQKGKKEEHEEQGKNNNGDDDSDNELLSKIVCCVCDEKGHVTMKCSHKHEITMNIIVLNCWLGCMDMHTFMLLCSCVMHFGQLGALGAMEFVAFCELLMLWGTVHLGEGG